MGWFFAVVSPACLEDTMWLGPFTLSEKEEESKDMWMGLLLGLSLPKLQEGNGMCCELLLQLAHGQEQPGKTMGVVLWACFQRKFVTRESCGWCFGVLPKRQKLR